MSRDPLNVRFDFTERPSPIPAILRPAWRITSLLLCLAQCRAGKANRKQLHVLNWAARNSEAQKTFLKVLDGTMDPDEAIVRFDPVLDRAVHFAVGEQLVFQSGDQLVMTAKGESLVKAVMKDRECMTEEKEFLRKIGRKLTQAQVEALF